MDPYRQYNRSPYNRGNMQSSYANPNNRSNQNHNFNPCNNSDCNKKSDFDHKSTKECDKCDDDITIIIPRDKQLAYGYFKTQTWSEMYSPSKALCEGTAFPCLNLVFCGMRGRM